MSNPVSFRSPAEIDSAYRTIVAAHSREASLRPLPPLDESAVQVGTAIEAADTVVLAAEMTGVVHSAAIAVGSTILAPIITAGAGLADIAHAWEENARRGAEVDSEQMRGALLYVLGRIPNPDRPEVVEQFGTNERDGARDAARWERTRPHVFEALRERTMTSFHGGENAALLGNLHGAALSSALRDPIFRMGYEETNALRTSDPATFAARAAEARALDVALDAGRSGTRIQG